MKNKVKELECQLEMLATDFYEASGARGLNIEIRITPYEITHHIVLEYSENHNETQAAPGGCK